MFFKQFTLRLLCICLMLLSVCFPAPAEQTPMPVDPISGLSMTSGDLEWYYQKHYIQIYDLYKDQLTDAERFADYTVHDAVRDINFAADTDESNRRRIINLSDLAGLKAMLTGFYDSDDASYTDDPAVRKRLSDILSACGLNIDDYLLSVLRNGFVSQLPPKQKNWICHLGHWADEKLYDEAHRGPIVDISIILSGDEMQVVHFVMNPDYRQ